MGLELHAGEREAVRKQLRHLGAIDEDNAPLARVLDREGQLSSPIAQGGAPAVAAVQGDERPASEDGAWMGVYQLLVSMSIGGSDEAGYAPPMLHSRQLREQLEAGIDELQSDIGRLRAAIDALDAADAPAAGHARAARSGRRSRAGADAVPAGKLTSLLRASAGLTTSELARETGGASDQILRRLKELEEAGTARRTGNRRSTRWHLAGERAQEVDGEEQTEVPAADPEDAGVPAAEATDGEA